MRSCVHITFIGSESEERHLIEFRETTNQTSQPPLSSSTRQISVALLKV